MAKVHSLVLLPLAGMMFSCSSTKKTTGAEIPTDLNAMLVKNITIDGMASDWKNVPEEVSPKGTFRYAIAQDAQNLYILLKVPDYAEQMKMLRGGMEVYLDPYAKENKTTEVIFPVKDELNADAMRPARTGDPKEMMALMHNKIKSELISLNRIGFKPEFTGVQSIFQNTGFKGAINWDENNVLVYELQVPLNAFQSPINSKDMAIGFSLHGLQRPSESSSSEGSGERTGSERSGGGMRGGGGGYGGMRGGGMRGSGYGGGNGGGYNRREGGENQSPTDWKKLGESESTWVKYKSIKES